MLKGQGSPVHRRYTCAEIQQTEMGSEALSMSWLCCCSASTVLTG